MKHRLLILIAASVASVSFVAWRAYIMSHEPVTCRGMVYDPSISFTGGCSALVGSADALLREPGVPPGSTLSVLALGDASTAFEPRRIAKYPIPMELKVIEGRSTGAERRAQILQQLWADCRSLRSTPITPIYRGMQLALADLRAQGCKAGSRCELWVATDLEENADRAIAARINGLRHVPSLPKPLDNSGTEITFCGFGQTAGLILRHSGREITRGVARDPDLDVRLQKVWRSLFSRPELVTFEPYCPQPSIAMR